MIDETNPSDSQSWFQRLGNVIISMLIPIINFLSFDHDKTKTTILDQALLIERYMMDIPTDYCNMEKLSDDTLILVHFPIIQRHIKAWKQHFEDVRIRELLLSNLAGELKSNEIRENVKEIEMIDSVPMEDLIEAQRFEKDVESA